MVRAVFMTPAQISELVELAHEDSAMWEELKDRELEIEKRLADAAKQGLDVDDRDAILDPPKLPTMGMILSDLVKKRYGSGLRRVVGTGRRPNIIAVRFDRPDLRFSNWRRAGVALTFES